MSKKRDLLKELGNLFGVVIPYRYISLLAEIGIVIVVCEILVFGVVGALKNDKSWNSYIAIIFSTLSLPALYTWHKLSQPEVERIESEIRFDIISYKRERLKPEYCEGCTHFRHNALTDEQGKQIICSRHPQELISQNCPDYEHHAEGYKRIQAEREKASVLCRKCLYCHGQADVGNFLVCALHADVRSDNNCPDYKSN
ncbi:MULTISPECIES: hypothetical protein [Nostoc]|uniref:HNH endonuclease n=2 Tax=Nostoc TaxID=1177 RepID=A0ABR8IKZ0_9NOSO|nr:MULTISPECIES: hypothetical protein [Nostoc]MBD2565407.1 hypothetical protein [Nostoc linckia FACHB-391]MBD2651165.1 hypothetical protein [Nostoc foliaceum FACHB-393]